MLTLAALCLGYFMVILDTTVVNVALPPLRHDLAVGVSGLQWVVDAYTLVFAALLLSGGALGDRLGGRRVLRAGLVLFTGASVACGLAPTASVLVAARALQGAGAALLVPASLALIRAAYRDRAARARAVGAWGAVAGIAAAAGPLVAGLLISVSSWRAVFFVNAPVGALALALSAHHVPAPRPNHARALDLPGQGAAVAALGALTFALIEAGRRGLDPLVLAAFAAAVAAALLLVAIERRSPAAVLPPALLASPTPAGANAVGLLINLGFYGQLFVVNLYFQEVRGASPLEAGLAVLPELAMATIASALAGRLMGRVGPRSPMLGGLLLGAGGLLGLTAAGRGTPYAVLVAPLVATGFGMALTMPAATAAAIESAPAERAGAASGVLNASRQVGGVIGVALLGALVAGGGDFVPGLRAALAVAVGAFLLGAAVAFAAVERKPAAERAAGP